MNDWQVIEGDCIEQMAAMPEASVDAIVTDPPYGLGFMGKAWDALPPGVEVAGQMLRVLKPGGHLLAFGGTRTYHRLACALEDAGFEIRDQVAWLYGTGFPKSLDVSKAIDASKGVKRQLVAGGSDGAMRRPRAMAPGGAPRAAVQTVSVPVTPEAAEWEGWGTALKPAHEPIVMARKPLVGTVAANVLEHGTGALNVDGCRVGTSKDVPTSPSRTGGVAYEGNLDGSLQRADGTSPDFDPAVGRWPANVVLDVEAAAILDEQSGDRPGMPRTSNRKGESLKGHGMGLMPDPTTAGYGDSGGASRFFYCAKASRAERNAGLDGFEERALGGHLGQRDGKRMGRSADEGANVRTSLGRNTHPTVKPIALMCWLVRLVTPPGGVVLDPFTGSGTTGIACLREGFDFIGIEREPDYCELARERIRQDQPLMSAAA